uniref:Uncharacterized protein n=1 Tax=Ditylenchus dipsaci TaxID=166011 RepID=A0A915DLW7_9BILA
MLRCLYPSGDHDFIASPWLELKPYQPVEPECDVFEVECSMKSWFGSSSYHNLYSQIYKPYSSKQSDLISQAVDMQLEETSTNPPDFETNFTFSNQSIDRNETPRYEGFGVHLLIIDSVSRSQFFRSMPKTVFLLKEEYEAIAFHHLNKVAINSRPNAYTLFMGKQAEDVLRSPLNEHTVKADPMWSGSKFVKQGSQTRIFKRRLPELSA